MGSNKKEIKDYLPFYLGCNAGIMGEDGLYKILSFNSDGYVGINYNDIGETEHYCSDVFPVLRKLEDATMQEKADAKNILRIDKWGTYTPESMAEFTVFMCKKGFDMFGLIESKLATHCPF